MPSIINDPKQLCDAARDAANNAYVEYSNFRVGAALTTKSATYTGANVESASYGLSLCAERAAITKAVNAGDRDLVRLAIACVDAKPELGINGIMPCGACRQWFIEFAPELEIIIWSENDGKIIGTYIAEDLLSNPFKL
ncbi:cytidine deaminase [Mycolicibacterium moriokaense]|uniref:Cytidine deaminase n=1 Tax=Mycolicibacterium moriokaense TaxID=39691 RepID=A0A318HDC8_9MYCO|nr:cytidine deaminase [Mycolicibacterium moriokaense]PXX06622.1 cytidine deaminase [Mycolicibacterium moriokaense]